MEAAPGERLAGSRLRSLPRVSCRGASAEAGVSRVWTRGGPQGLPAALGAGSQAPYPLGAPPEAYSGCAKPRTRGPHL